MRKIMYWNNIGNLALYYLAVFTPLAFNMAVFFFLINYMHLLDTNVDYNAWSIGIRLFWFCGIVVAVFNFVGFLLLGHPDTANGKAVKALWTKGWPAKQKLVVVYVSRGDNANALRRSIVHTKAVLDAAGAEYRIDAVTDIRVSHGKTARINFYTVPQKYNTANGAKWKARALHFLVEQHRYDEYLDKNTWVLHLDEESQLHESSLAGIRMFITASKNKNRVGQGEIKYNAYKYASNLFITWMDSVRSGDDVGRFRLQYSLFKQPLFGMHGSYFLVPYRLEQKYGYDLGGRGSVTEDAYFALKCAEDGIKFSWINGYIREQSPYSLGAVIKQRRRWFCGLLSLSLDRQIGWRVRMPLMVNTFLWAFSWVGPLATIVSFAIPSTIPWQLLLITLIMQAFYSSIYLMGAYRNLQDVANELSLLRKALVCMGSFITIPLTGMVEGLSVLYALIQPVKTFDVVNKN